MGATRWRTSPFASCMAVPGKHRFRLIGSRWRLVQCSPGHRAIEDSGVPGTWWVRPAGVLDARALPVLRTDSDQPGRTWLMAILPQRLHMSVALTAYQLKSLPDRRREAQQEAVRRADYERRQKQRVFGGRRRMRRRAAEGCRGVITLSCDRNGLYPLQAGYGLEPLQIGSQYDLYFAVDRLRCHR